MFEGGSMDVEGLKAQAQVFKNAKVIIGTYGTYLFSRLLFEIHGSFKVFLSVIPPESFNSLTLVVYSRCPCVVDRCGL